MLFFIWKNTAVRFISASMLISLLGLLRCTSENEEIRTKTDIRNLNNSSSTFIYNMIPEEEQAQISSPYSNAVNTFSVNLLSKIYDSDLYRGKNIIVSPYCLDRNLSIITEAATGETQQELINALGGRVALDDANSALRKLLHTDKSVFLQIADAIWIDSNKYTIMPTFKDTANKKYGVELAGLNFSDVNTSIKTINSWIAKNTAFRIESAVKESYIGEYTGLF